MFIEVVSNGTRVLVNLDRVTVVKRIGTETYIEFGPGENRIIIEETYEQVKALIENVKSQRD